MSPTEKEIPESVARVVGMPYEDVVREYNNIARPAARLSVHEFAAGNPAHFDNQSVEAFAYAMRVKLAIKRQEGRGGWQNKEVCSNAFLSQLLREHVEKGDPVDVANFCMMLHQRGETIAAAPQTLLKGDAPGAKEAFDAVHIADRLISAAYGDEVPKEWHKAIRAVQKARSALAMEGKDNE